MKNSVLKLFVFSGSSSILLALAFPFANCLWLAWVAFVPFLFLIDHVKTPRAAFGLAWVSGFLFFFSTLFWIRHVTFLGLVFLVAYLAVYYGGFGLFVFWSRRFSLIKRLFLIPAAWVVLEYLRDHLLTGFGWVSLGHSQSNNLLLIQIVDVTGVAGVSFVLMAFNVLLKEGIVLGKGLVSSRPFLVVVRIFVAVLVVILGYGAWRLSQPIPGKTVRVALVQGNVSLLESWDEFYRPDVVRRLLSLSQEQLPEKPDIVVWPESSFPGFYWESPALFKEITGFARDHATPLLLGIVTKDGNSFHNSAMQISGGGDIQDIYSKVHLVLFGEYIPFRKELPFLAALAPIDDFTPGEKWPLVTLKDGVKAGTLVCFEDTLPWMSRRWARQGAGILINLTNDAWFRGSPQPVLHLDNARFRAVETRRPLVRATNTGMSCLVNAYGVTERCVKDFSGRSILVSGSTVVGVKPGNSQTFYTKFGDAFTFICFLGILAHCLINTLRWKIHSPHRTD